MCIRDSFGVEGVAYEIAVLEAPNMLFEFIEFEHNADKPMRKMPVNGPGMTHTCFQSASNDSGYEKFGDAGAAILSYSNQPIDLGGYGVTYAYGYDPEGNMFEMEQLDPEPLAQVETKLRWIDEGHSMWMTQVALVTHDIERLTNWYADIMAFMPYRTGDYEGHPRMAEVAGEPYLCWHHGSAWIHAPRPLSSGNTATRSPRNPLAKRASLILGIPIRSRWEISQRKSSG